MAAGYFLGFFCGFFFGDRALIAFFTSETRKKTVPRPLFEVPYAYSILTFDIAMCVAGVGSAGRVHIHSGTRESFGGG